MFPRLRKADSLENQRMALLWQQRSHALRLDGLPVNHEAGFDVAHWD
jgi:hypothetical protein